ncbi:protein LIM3-like [Tasmannia lanceolata]|uniref:protein LIM3-like n=1 Tax=Tasmannia lanceolata TaxID=3420 RepID=UPI00406392E2
MAFVKLLLSNRPLFRFSKAIFLLLICLAGQAQMGRAQNCSADLINLNPCAPYVVPGSTSTNDPSPQCCSSLEQVNHECLCSTIRIITRIPSFCNLPPITCPSE